MAKTLEKFLEFEGKRISLLTVDGTWWVAVKPICDVLGIQYENQRIKISEDDILSTEVKEQQVTANDNKLRLMLCLPEKYIYGWIFSLSSESAELKKYKRKCYEILYNHFHGVVTGRINLLTEKNAMLEEIDQLNEGIDNSDEMQRVRDLKKKVKETEKSLKNLDTDLVRRQLDLFN